MPGNNLFDDRIQTLHDYHPVVGAVHADRYGGFQILFTDDTVLEAFPNSSDDSTEETWLYDEEWRMFVPGGDSPDFIVTNRERR